MNALRSLWDDLVDAIDRHRVRTALAVAAIGLVIVAAAVITRPDADPGDVPAPTAPTETAPPEMGGTRPDSIEETPLGEECSAALGPVRATIAEQSAADAGSTPAFNDALSAAFEVCSPAEMEQFQLRELQPWLSWVE